MNISAQILESAESAGLNLSYGQAELCRLHIELMLEWNRRLNLTRITNWDEIIVKHLLDSLLPARTLSPTGPILDVGTGAGFPGIPIKVLYPDLPMTLLDSSRKKVSFLSAAVAKLGLKQIHPVHGRWEEFSETTANRETFGLITMRAVRLEPGHLSILAVRLLSAGGAFAWWSGPESEATAADVAQQNPSCMGPRQSIFYTLPGIVRPRSLQTWTKVKNHPED